MFEAGQLNDVQSAFFKPQGAEELYDLSSDPYETVNLASDPDYAGKLEEMRRLMKDNILSKGDLVLVPEAIWVDHAGDMKSFKESVSDKLGAYYDAAQMQIKPYAEMKKDLKKALKSSDPVIRYWGVSAGCCQGDEAAELGGEMKKLLDDDFSVVRSRAALYCVLNGIDVPENIYHRILASAENEAATLMILNDMALLFDQVPEFNETVSDTDLKFFPNGYQGRLKYFKRCSER